MDRYGAPHFRESSAQSYPVRQPPSRSGLLGPVPPPDHRPQPQSILKNSRQSEWQGARPAASTRDGILGAPPKQASRDNYGGRPATWDERHIKPNDGRKSDEVSQLMKSLGLSQSDIQKLSQMPENEINVNNLARAIGDLKKGQSPQFPKDRTSAYDPAQPTADYDYNRRGSSYQSNSRAPYQRNDASAPREPPYSRGDTSSYNPPTSSGFKSAGPPRNQPLPRKQAPMPDNDSYGNSRNVDRRRERGRDDDDYHSRDERDRYTRSSSDQYSQARNETLRTKRIVEEINDDRQGHVSGYGRQTRMDSGKKSQPPRSVGNTSRPAPRGLLRGPDHRSSPDKGRRWERGSGSSAGLLGNPLQPNAQGLNSLAAAVGRSPQSSLSVTQAASTVLNPLLLAGQTDPAVLEVQLQAIKVLQAEALKQQPSRSSASSFDSHNSSKPRQARQSYPPTERLDRREEDNRRNAKKEADEMRAMRGRVLYMRFKSNRILELDLKQLAAAFGRVTNILIIRAKIPNGFNQAFMEMEQYDCAAAMVEHYKAKPPIVCGCSVLVDRSNYRDLQLRINPQDRKRERSISPIRKGTTQLPSKRLREGRFEEEPRLNVLVSENKRLVTHTAGKTPPKDAKHDNKNDSKRKGSRSSSADRKKSSRSKTPEKRRTSDRRRPTSAQKTNTKESSKKDETKAEKDEAAKKKPEEEKVEKVNDESEDTNAEKKNVKQMEKTKDTVVEADPLDAIADELALHDDFSIMDDYNHEEDKEAKQAEVKETKEQQKDGKDPPTDLDLNGGDLDLEDVNVDVSQDEEEVPADKDAMKTETDGQDDSTETDAVPFVEPMDDVKQEDAGDEIKTEVDFADVKQEVNDVKVEENPEDKKTEKEDGGDEVDGKVDEIQVKEEESVEMNESQTEDSQPDVETSQETVEEGIPSPDVDAVDDEEEEDVNQEQEESLQDSSPNDQADEVARLKFIITSALQEVNNARDQLVALNKTTKNRATVAVSKKLKLCLDGAVTRLEGADEA
uniref:Uncharacterized protein LOC100185482 n=1 Tax=Phallusia mammillata TaxID=59560 RepID=A0A6F9DIB4_9ASCI|nr:uncharacterized protein LOC100185482 [Phallusia mammillata]